MSKIKNKAKSAFLKIEVFMKKLGLIFLLIIIIIISQTSCSVKHDGNSKSEEDHSAPVSKEGFFFDTVCKITIFDMDNMSKENAEDAIDKSYKEAAKYEKVFSRQVDGSELWNLNKKGELEASDDLFTVIQAGLKYGDISGGKFDITMGPVLDLWKFNKEGVNQLPKEEDIKKALELVDYKIVEASKLNDSQNLVKTAGSGSEIDLGGIAKGYICDRISESLSDRGVTSAIVNLGGNITVIGEKPGNKPFNVAIEKPFSERKDMIGIVKMKNGTIVTSGTYERYVEVGGKKYHHILDPATGWPIDTDVVSVTILSKIGNSMECDAMSTTALLLGSERGLQLIEQAPEMEALFQLKDGTITKSSGFEYEEGR